MTVLLLLAFVVPFIPREEPDQGLAKRKIDKEKEKILAINCFYNAS